MIQGSIIGDLSASVEKTNSRLVLFTPSGTVTGRPVRGAAVRELASQAELLAKLIDETYCANADEYLVLREVTVQQGDTVHSAEFLVVFLHTVTGVTLSG